MRKSLKVLAVASAAVLSVSLSACGGSSESQSNTSKLIVGASPSPHAKILNFVKDNLAKDAGLDLEIKEYSDYIQPNEALAAGDLDANYFQTVPYLEEQQAKNKNYNFQAGKPIHLEPIGIYSKKLKNIKELKDGAKVGIINDPTNQGRGLQVLAEAGLIKLPTDSKEQNVLTIKNSSDYNPHKYDFQEIDGPLLVRTLDDIDVAIINGNFAQEGNLKPSDALILEKAENNPSNNILVWNKDTKKKKALAKLEELLHSAKTKEYIEKTWPDKSVIPSF